MDCSSVTETFITKFEINTKPHYAKIHWMNDESDLFHIQIFSDDQSWFGNFSNEIAKSFEERLYENTFEYSLNVKNALKRSGDFIYDFTQLESNPSEWKFCWKRTFSDSTAVLVHGFVVVQPNVPTETKDQVIDFLINENKKLQSAIENLKKNNNLLNNELDKCKGEFEQLVDIKDSLESSLYGKFIQLLNEKKRRIKLLENHIAALEVDDNT